jgi:hypothetical protein
MLNLSDIKEGDYIICFTERSTVGGMSFRQDYFKVGKKYKVSKSILSLNGTYGTCNIISPNGGYDPTMTSKAEIFITLNEFGYHTPIGQFSDYFCTESQYREMKLNQIGI